jgi:DinB family protein
VPNKTLRVEQILTILSETPRRIARLTADLAPAQLRSVPEHGEWSAHEVLAHLRACADVWGDCMVAMIDQDAPTLRAINPRSWIEKTDYLEQEFQPSLRAFAKQRKDLLKVLKPLTTKAWSRSAIVTGAGTPLERTVLYYGRWLAGHERRHVKQIESIVNTMEM